jgi:hypothetical protein
MATPRKRRKTTALVLRGEIRDQLAALNRTKPDTGKDEDDRPLTPREEYRAALAELNSYSHENETEEALSARERFDRADRKRHWWSR